MLCDLKHGTGSGDIAPWDLACYCEMHKALSPPVGRFDSPQAELSRFLSLGAYLSAVEELSWELFGLRLLPRPLGPSENWLKPEGPGIGMGIESQAAAANAADDSSHDSHGNWCTMSVEE